MQLVIIRMRIGTTKKVDGVEGEWQKKKDIAMSYTVIP